ncbi:MAG TPA: DNA polymerase Y family protein [Actinomycetes bacterium]
MARVLAIWCPDWPVVAAGAPATEPVAVMDGGRVLACSAAARAEGVRPGQRRRQAQERCPEVRLIPYDPDRDARAFEPVLVAVESLTSRIEVLRPGECVFPARGAARYHGGEVALATTILTAVDQVLGALCRSQVGIANGRFPATLAARHAPGRGPSASADDAVGPGCGLADGPRGSGAALADGPRGSSSARTDGALNPGSDPADRQFAARRWIVPTETTLDFLAGFPVAVLERPELTDLLIRLGLSTLGDLAALPRAAMAARFGPEGVRAHRLASGLDEHPRASRRPAPDLGVATELDSPAMRVDVVAFAAKALADKLVDHLERLGLACTRLRIEVETEHGETLARVWRHEPPARPSRRGAATDPRAARVASIAERVRWQLDGWLTGSAATRPTGAITRLALIPDEAIAARGRQLGFWGEETEAGQRAARALARVQGLLGPEAVRRVSLRGGRAPADRVVSVAEGELPGTGDPSANGRPNAGKRPGAHAHGIPEPGAPTGGSATRGVSKARVRAAARSDAAARLDVPLREGAGLPEDPGARHMKRRETLGGDGRSDDAGSTVARRTLPAGNGPRRRRPRGDGGAGQQVVLFPGAPDSPGSADDPGSSRDAANAVGPAGGPGRPQGSSGPIEPDSVVAPDGPPRMEPAAAQPPRVSRRDPKVPPWPGRIPEPSPAIVHHEPVTADVRDTGGAGVSVNGRGMLSAEPSWLQVDGDWARIVAWAGPWPVDERWWDPNARRRLARLQVTTQKDLAYLLKLTDGRWWVEATYD